MPTFDQNVRRALKDLDELDPEDGDFIVGQRRRNRNLFGRFPVGGTGGVALFDDTFIDVRWREYGAIANGSYSSGSGTWGGTDNKNAIQQALVDHVYTPIGGAVVLPIGISKITRGLHLQYGAGGFKSGHLQGQRRGFVGEGQYGTVLAATFNDEPIVSVQGARVSSIGKMSIAGVNYQHILNSGLGHGGASVDDSDIAVWKGANLGTNSDSRFAPYAGIAVDPYVTAGAQTYPPYDHPDELALFTDYGRSFSSDVQLYDLGVIGVWVGVVVSPSDALGNADFVRWTGGDFYCCPYVFSLGQSQTRSSKIEDVTGALFHTAITSNKFGQQNGKLGDCINCSFAFGIQVYDVGSVATPINFIGLYTESIWRIGDWSTVTASEASINHIGCQFGFNNQDPTYKRGVPSTVLRNSGNRGTLRFDGGFFANFHCLNFDVADGLEINGTLIQPQIDPTTAAVRTAHNATMGQLMMRNLASGGMDLERIRPAYRYFNLDTGAEVGGIQARRIHNVHTRPFCTPLWSAWHFPTDPARLPLRANAIAVVSLSNSSLSGRTWTFTYASLDDDTAMIYGLLPGDVIYHDDSDTWFIVTARSGDDITATMMGNYKPDGLGSFVMRSGNLNSGNIFVGNSRYYHPTDAVYGTFTAGSDTITAVGNREGTISSFLESDIPVGDYLGRFTILAGLVSDAGARITARSNAGATITLAANALLSSVGRVRIGSFIRTAPT